MFPTKDSSSHSTKTNFPCEHLLFLSFRLFRTSFPPIDLHAHQPHSFRSDLPLWRRRWVSKESALFFIRDFLLLWQSRSSILLWVLDLIRSSYMCGIQLVLLRSWISRSVLGLIGVAGCVWWNCLFSGNVFVTLSHCYCVWIVSCGMSPCWLICSLC